MMNTHISTHRQLQVKGPAMIGQSSKNPTPQRCRVTAINVQSSVIPIIISSLFKPFTLESPVLERVLGWFRVPCVGTLYAG